MNAFEWMKLYFQNEDRELTSTKATMAALLSYADFHELTCFPSQSKLAKVTALDIRTVKRHIRKNVEAGWLTVIEPGKALRKPNVYRLTTPTGVTSVTSSTNLVGELVTSVTATGDSSVTQLVTPVSPITIHRTNQELPTRGTGDTDVTSSRTDTTPDPEGGPGLTSGSNATTQSPTGVRNVTSRRYAPDRLDDSEKDLIESALVLGPRPVHQIARQTGLSPEAIIARAQYSPFILNTYDDDPFDGPRVELDPAYT